VLAGQEGAVSTKRLLRQIVTPSALAYALFGFFAGLLWLSVNAHAPALGMAAPTELPRPIAASASGRVTLQDAIGSVRLFAGQPSLILEGGLQTEGTVDSRQGSQYYLESVSPTRGEDFFKVDARTAEVIEATFRGRMAPTDEAVNLSLTDAETLASRFARTHFWGFDQLALVERSTRTGESGAIHAFKWSQIAPDSGAELPVSVSLAVSARSGQVFWYLSQRDPLQIEPRPAIEQTRAIEIARTWLLPRDQRWDLDQPASMRLQVLYDDDDQQQLVWSVLFNARQEGPRSSIRLLIDAQSGHLIQSGS
jgi:hypothetical protein